MIEFDIHEVLVKRQIDALVRLQSNRNGVGQWLDLSRNQEHNALPDADLLRGRDDKVINSAVARLLSLKNWNAQQKAAFRSLSMTKEGCSILEGFPGCGKTTDLVATAIFFYYCDLQYYDTPNIPTIYSNSVAFGTREKSSSCHGEKG